MAKKKAEPFNVSGGDFYPTPHYCQWCGNYHYGLCPQSIAPVVEEIRIRLNTLQQRDDELEAMIQYLFRKIKRMRKTQKRITHTHTNEGGDQK